ncbi:MAG: tetratricopeptide repeat protein, partial [Caldilineaceae bacterium]|nr:tetratricopeptide repeat protein [Caldilineaceae bacterium]
VADDHRYTFFDGVWWVALASHATLDAALVAIAQALAIDLRAGTDPATQIAHVLHEQEALLILDNGEHLPQAALREFVRTLLAAAPQLIILLTSRLPLGLPQEIVIPLTGLTDHATGEQLFRQTATRVGGLAETAEERHAIAQICRLVDGMPLAIQLAAGLTDLHSCEMIADQLRSDLATLQTAKQDVPERQRSVHALLTTTWAERTSTEQRALRKLTIFAGSFSRNAAKQIAQLSTSDFNHLCDLALLQREGTRFTLHELLRQYIQAQQMQAVEPAAQAALHRHYQGYFLTLIAEQATVLQTAQAATAIGLIAEELGNVQQAWRLAATTATIELLAAAWQPLTIYYRRRGPFAEGATLLAGAAETLQAAAPPDHDHDTATEAITPLCCCLQIAAADLYLLAGNFTRALQLADATLALAGANHCDWAQVDARLKETHALRALGRLAEAQTAIERATTTIATLPEAIAVENLRQPTIRNRHALQLELALEQGQLAIDCGNVTAAAAALEEALTLAHDQNDETSECLAACELCYVSMALAKYDAADSHLRRALHIARNWADTRLESQVLARQARLYRECGDVEQWQNSSEAALALCRRIGDLVGEARSLNELGIFYRQQGAYRQAQRCFQETLDPLRRTHDRPFETLALQNLGALELICGRHTAARTHLRQACDLCDELAGIDMQCVLRVYLSWHAAETGDGAQALAYAQAALTLAEATGRPAFLIFVQVT